MMKFNRLLGAGVMAAVMAVAPAFADELADKVREMNLAWDTAFNSGDASAVAAMYAEDAKVITGDGTVKEGRDEIQALFQSFLDSGFGKHKITLADVKGGEDMVYETGAWSGIGGDGNEYGGKLVLIYERGEDGDLKTVLHMWN